MKRKQLLVLAGLVLLCNLTLTACQTAKKQQTNQPKTKQVSKKANSKKQKTAKKARNSKKARKGVAGIDFPTDDGFILTKESKILSKTAQGIIVDHNGHSHFIFYADLKGSSFEYLIPNGAKLTKPEGAKLVASEKSSVKATDPHHHYEFNPADIVAEDALGYTVRHGDHFHYILKSSLSGRVQEQAKQVATHLPQTTGPISTATTRGIPGLHFPTSDGFKFTGQGIVGVTKDSILVNHDGHLHPISFTDLRQGGWAHLADQYDPSTKSQKPAKPTEAEQADLEKEYQEKLAYLASKLGLDPSVIKRVKTQDGRLGLEYPHHDHAHVLMLSDIEIGKDIPDPHAIEHARELEKHKVGMATLKALGFDDEVILDIVRTHDAPTPFPSNETNPEKMKDWLATVTKIDLGSRANPLERYGLSMLPNLEILGIGFTPIKDISPVLQFKKLKQLLMTRTGITDYSFLDYMPHLESIDISQNNIKDISFLSKYKRLSLVAAADNGITDISPLAQLPNLKFLVLSNNAISDLTPLSSLTKLQELHVDNNQITDLSPISYRETLTVVDLSRNKNVDLSTLKAPKLETLMLNGTNVNNLAFLKDNPNVSTLAINHANLGSLDGVEASKVIGRLEAQGNQIKTLVLKDKQGSLTFLNVTGNQLTSLEGVNNFTALDTLSASKNQLTDVALSEPNKTITSLDVSHNHIPLTDLKVNDQGIPETIAKNFPAVQGGSIVGNGTAEEKAATTGKADNNAKKDSETQEQKHDVEQSEKENHSHDGHAH
ncbi:leucine-rich repeat domain-containing protein [Streptococcus castoreus]|uniref:leucine-rich repeat domain-containing protein n=1 Tax=Streptococcus castoreus TaxID=254786 RepID=UPI000429596A|nr:leucine-rich repeat domain-containing protein [Streptococcus castoreus]